MPLFWLILIITGIAAAGYVLGRSRALQSVGGDIRALHSLPIYYGANAALKSIVPAVGLVVLWLLVQPVYVNSVISGLIPDSAMSETASRSLGTMRREPHDVDNRKGRAQPD